MTAGKKSKGRPKGHVHLNPTVREWVGGRMASPFFVTEGTPYRPDLILWLELPDDLILFASLSDPKETPTSFGETLLQAMRAPLAGPPRKPQRVRVADPHLAAELRRLLPEVQIIEAPTPELNRVLEHMSETMSARENREKPSYLEGGRVPIQAVEALFRGAQVLYELAPWKAADDSQLLRVDIPAYGVKGACLSIIGALGESLGIILFPSLAGFERFLEAAAAAGPPGGPIDMGTTALSLTFEAGSDLPAPMYREVLQHGWPVADAQAYPVVQHRERDGVPRPLTERDVRIASACATSLAAFFARHGRIFEGDGPAVAICESYFDKDDLEVRFTLPYGARARGPR